MSGVPWQRCRVHFRRNVHEQFKVIAAMLGRQALKVPTMMRDAKEDLLAPLAAWVRYVEMPLRIDCCRPEKGFWREVLRIRPKVLGSDDSVWIH